MPLFLGFLIRGVEEADILWGWKHFFRVFFGGRIELPTHRIAAYEAESLDNAGGKWVKTERKPQVKKTEETRCEQQNRLVANSREPGELMRWQ